MSAGERIAVVGAGYVGLTTATVLAHLGHDVVCADIDEERVAMLERGQAPMYEEGLTPLLEAGLDSGLLRFVVGASVAADHATIAFLCVPTPQAPDGYADLSYVETAARQIAPVLAREAIVVNKSTVPVGSTIRVANCF